MSRFTLHRRALSFLAVTLVASCGESALDFELGFQRSEQPIVYGDREYGWDGVGALTLTHAGYGYTGSFCSATLIDSQWVLTAAHCLFDHSGYEVYTQGVRFYIGDNAQPNGYSGEPSSGTLHQAGDLIPHEDYDPNLPEDHPNAHDYDIGLVWLSTPVPGAGGIELAYNTANITSLSGDDAFYVGFGQDQNDNSGIKRSTTLPIDYVSYTTYTSDQSSTGVCFGDSGGPGLFDFDPGAGTDWRVIGVNSTVAGSSCVSGNASSNQTRVDAYALWIANKMSVNAPSCQDDISLCACETACQGAGWCDNTACQTDTCRDIYYCMVDCADDDGCAMTCYNNGSTAGKTSLDNMYRCFGDNCNEVPDEQYQACIEQHCQTQMDTCFPVITGDATCEEAYDCIFDCPDDDSTCVQDCVETGTALAQEQMNTMWDCWDTECGTLEGDAWSNCIYQSCATEMDTCWPPANCALTGGDCEAGTACYPTSTGANDCFDSDEVARGESCDPDIADRLVCDDGLICLSDTQTTASCYAFCTVVGDCLAGEDCYIFNGSNPPLGYCDLEATCTDADQDGFCVEDDCDDTNAAVNPDATEACNDAIDNNCDGFTDEGCSGCTDADADGYCADVDCDDSNALVWPGAPENCADTIDNDCDTFVDDDDILDCPSGCPDADGDGFPNGQCGGPDCNDSQPTWYPGAAENCHDTYDKNCDGSVVACIGTGGACTDNLQCATGVCAPHLICIDPNAPIVQPREIKDDGGCRSSATGAPVLPTALAFLLLRRRRK